MKIRYGLVILASLLLLQVGSCGSKRTAQPQPKDASAQKEKEAADQKKQAVVSAEQRIRQWLGQELSQKVGNLAKDIGKNLGAKLSLDQEIAKQSKYLSRAVFDDKEVKARLDKISDEATKGLANKLTLGWKVIRAGGIDNFKARIKADTQQVAVDVLSEYLQNQVLKDARTAELLKDFGPALKMQAKVAAVSVEANLSARVTKKILSISLKILAAGDQAEMAGRVEAWIGKCRDTANSEVDKFMRGIGELKSLSAAAQGLAAEVLGHDTTKRELTVMMKNLIEDKEVNKALVKVYNSATFEKGQDQVRRDIQAVLALPATDRELFAAMQRLAAAPGAVPMINKHALKVSEDPDTAKLIEEFVINLLESCGDPTAGR